MADRAPKYRYIRRLGSGGMAEVFEAAIIGAEGFERRVAIKRILPSLSGDETFAAMFVNEARLSARLRHPNIVQVLDFDRDEEDRLFLVMELVEGRSLDKLLTGTPLPLSVALHITAEILKGLVHAHELEDDDGQPMRIVHRDVSPHNVLVARDGAVKLSDFGIAKAMGVATLQTSGTIKGKASYLAPEQLTSPASLDGRTDLFAVGVILYEMLTGRHVYRGTSTEEVLADVVQVARGWRRVIDPHDVSPQLQGIVLRLLEVHPKDRFPSARDALTFAETMVPPEASGTLADLVTGATGSESDGASAETNPDEHIMKADTRTVAPRQAQSGHQLTLARRRSHLRRLWAGLTLVAASVIAVLVVGRRHDDISPGSPSTAREQAPRTSLATSIRNLTSRGDVDGAGLSPDGTQLAFVANDSLFLMSLADRNVKRVATIPEVSGTGVNISWSRDGTHIGVQSIGGENFATLSVELRDGRVMKYPFGVGVMLETGEMAVFPSRRKLRIYGEDTMTVKAECDVPFADKIIQIASASYSQPAHLLVLAIAWKGIDERIDEHICTMGTDCSLHTCFPAGNPRAIGLAIAVTDTPTLLVPRGDEGAYDVFEYSMEGALLDTRREPGQVGTLAGRREGRDYVRQSPVTTSLERVDGRGARTAVFSTSSSASLDLSPDGKAAVWVAGGPPEDAGPLRIAPLDQLDATGPVLVDHVKEPAWSPDGSLVAAIATDSAEPLVVVNPATKAVRRIALDGVYREGLIWIDARHLALWKADFSTWISVDIESGETGVVFPPVQRGAPVGLQRSRVDGRLAFWSSLDGGGVWVLRVGEPPRLAVPGVKMPQFQGWSHRGWLLLSEEGRDYFEVNPDTGERRSIATAYLQPSQSLNNIFEMPDGRLLLAIVSYHADVYELTAN